MGFGLIGSALAGGLAGAGAAGEKAFARMGEEQGRQELETLRGQIDTDRQRALAKYNSQLRRDDLKFAEDTKREYQARDRSEITGIVNSATADMRDSQRPESEIRRAGRDALANSGRFTEAAAYESATAPEKLTVTTTPYGSITTRTDASGREVGRVDNAAGIRATNDTTRAARTGAGRAPKELDQAGLDKIHDSAVKFADRLVGEMPHPLADPTATGKDAQQDLALKGVARSMYSRALTRAAQSGVNVDPAEIEDAIRQVAPEAHDRAMARAEAAAANFFDEKGRPKTGADAAMREFGVRAADRDTFIRQTRDKLLPDEVRGIFAEKRGQREKADGEPAKGGEGGGGARTEPPSTEGERPDDAGRLAKRETGLIGNASTPATPGDELGTALDAARAERASATQELQRFGLRQQKQDPAGFRAAQQRVQQAEEALRRAQTTYERSVSGGNNQVGFSALQRGQ